MISLRERLDAQQRALQRRGGNPRRVDPRWARPIVLTWAQAMSTLVVAVGSGGLAALLILVATALWTDLRPARPRDIRLATLVRAALPDIDSWSQNELVAQLAIPSRVSKALAPLVATDPRWTALDRSWLDGVLAAPPAVVTPGRIEALGQLLSSLAGIPYSERADTIHDLVVLYAATLDPDSRMLLQQVGGLPRDTRHVLAQSLATTRLLAAMASLTETQRMALADGRLQMLPHDEERLRLITSIQSLEPTTMRLINRLDQLDQASRQALIYTVEQIQSGSPMFLSLLTRFWQHDPRLTRVLADPAVPAASASPPRR